LFQHSKASHSQEKTKGQNSNLCEARCLSPVSDSDSIYDTGSFGEVSDREEDPYYENLSCDEDISTTDIYEDISSEEGIISKDIDLIDISSDEEFELIGKRAEHYRCFRKAWNKRLHASAKSTSPASSSTEVTDSENGERKMIKITNEKDDIKQGFYSSTEYRKPESEFNTGRCSSHNLSTSRNFEQHKIPKEVKNHTASFHPIHEPAFLNLPQIWMEDINRTTIRVKKILKPLKLSDLSALRRRFIKDGQYHNHSWTKVQDIVITIIIERERVITLFGNNIHRMVLPSGGRCWTNIPHFNKKLHL